MREDNFTILVLDDDPDAVAYLEILLPTGHLLYQYSRWNYDKSFIEVSKADTIFIDLDFDYGLGEVLLPDLCERFSTTPFVVYSHRSDTSSVVKAMKSGAFDFIPKPVDVDALRNLLARCGRVRRDLLQKRGLLPLPLIPGRQIPGFSEKELLRNLFLDEPILVSGEHGTGKTSFAWKIIKADNSLFTVVSKDCRLINSFDGFLKQIKTGFLFLENVNFLSDTNQERLFSFIFGTMTKNQGRMKKLKIVATQLVSAATPPLNLLSRLACFFKSRIIHLKPLRERKRDLEFLCREILAQQAQKYPSGLVRNVSPGALAKLRSYDWPGNIAELEKHLHLLYYRLRKPTIEEDDILL